VLDSELETDNLKPGPNPCEQRIAARFGIKAQGRPADKWLADTVRWTWKVKVYTHLELELVGELREPKPMPVEWKVGETPSSTQRRQSGS